MVPIFILIKHLKKSTNFFFFHFIVNGSYGKRIDIFGRLVLKIILLINKTNFHLFESGLNCYATFQTARFICKTPHGEDRVFCYVLPFLHLTVVDFNLLCGMVVNGEFDTDRRFLIFMYYETIIMKKTEIVLDFVMDKKTSL